MGINMVGFQFPEELLVQFEPECCALSESEGLKFPKNKTRFRYEKGRVRS